MIRLKIGTKSVLYGAHCFFLHPFFVALAWWKLYGFPLDPRLWIAFFVHDLGYVGKPNMDGEEGERHPYWGACLMGLFFGPKWYEFTLYHSRFLAKKSGAQYSRLCVADKYSFILTPRWIYLPMVRMTGEVKEYMKHANEGKYLSEKRSTESLEKWHASVSEYMLRWVKEHKEIKEDNWTPVERKEEGNV